MKVRNGFVSNSSSSSFILSDVTPVHTKKRVEKFDPEKIYGERTVDDIAALVGLVRDHK